MNPLVFLKLIPTKVWGILAIILLAGTALHFFGQYRFEQGASKVQNEWDTEKVATALRHSAELATRYEENEAQAEAYRQALSQQKKRYEDEMAENKRTAANPPAYGLRVPESICTDVAAAAGSPKAGGTKGSDGPPAGTVALPKTVERDLRELMARADKIVAGCRAGQEFIRENGFEEK